MLQQILLSKPTDELSPKDLERIADAAVNDYAYPLALSYLNQAQAENPNARASVILKDGLSTVLQYLALLGLWDYADSEVPREHKVYAAVEQMVHRPGPGKWLGFLRTLNQHYRAQTPPASFRVPGMADFLSRFTETDSEQVILVEDGVRKKLSVLDALVMLRNRWAHAKGWPSESLEVLTTALPKLFAHVYQGLEFLTATELLATDDQGQEFLLKGARPVLPPATRGAEREVCLRLADRAAPLMRLMIEWNDADKMDILLLEEIIQRRQALYSSSFSSRRLDRERPGHATLLDNALAVLEKVRAESPALTLEKANFEVIARRMNAQTLATIDDFEANGKYLPDCYAPPATARDGVEAFFADKSALLLPVSGEQGVGKSALAAHYARQLAREPGNAVFFIEANMLPAFEQERNTVASLFNAVLSSQLRLEPRRSFKSYLERLAEGTDGRLLLIVDGLNEYEGEPADRERLLRELPRLVQEYEEALGAGRVKLLMTLRWSIFETLGTPRKDFVEHWRRLGAWRQADASGLGLVVPPLGREQSGALYEALRQAHVGMSPKFGWEELPAPLQDMCANPLMLQLFLRTYDAKERSGLNVADARGLKRKYVEELFLPQRRDSKDEKAAKTARASLAKNILLAMQSRISAHLPLLPAENAAPPTKKKADPYALVLEAAGDRARLGASGLEASRPYVELLEHGVLREDLVRPLDGSPPHKRLSFNHEIIAQLLLIDLVRLEAAKDSKGTSIASWIVFILFAASSFVLSMNIMKMKDEVFFLFISLCTAGCGCTLLELPFLHRIRLALLETLHTRASIFRSDILLQFKFLVTYEKQTLERVKWTNVFIGLYMFFPLFILFFPEVHSGKPLRIFGLSWEDNDFIYTFFLSLSLYFYFILVSLYVFQYGKYLRNGVKFIDSKRAFDSISMLSGAVSMIAVMATNLLSLAIATLYAFPVDFQIQAFNVYSSIFSPVRTIILLVSWMLCLPAVIVRSFAATSAVSPISLMIT